MACPAPTLSDLSSGSLDSHSRSQASAHTEPSLPTQRGVCLNVQDCQEVKSRFPPESPEKSYPTANSQSLWSDAGWAINRLGSRLPALDCMAPTFSYLSTCVFGLWTLKVQAPSN